MCIKCAVFREEAAEEFLEAIRKAVIELNRADEAFKICAQEHTPFAPLSKKGTVKLINPAIGKWNHRPFITKTAEISPRRTITGKGLQ